MATLVRQGLKPALARPAGQALARAPAPGCGLALLCGLTLVAGVARAQPQDAAGTSFLEPDELAARLLPLVVRVRADDLNEQGFGLVVGADASWVWVLTAGHVVSRPREEDPDAPGRRSSRVRVMPCPPADTAGLEAGWVESFETRGDDLALLRAPRPAGFVPVERALAGAAEAGEVTRVMGFEAQCAVLGTLGRVELAPDAHGLLQLRHPGVRGGSSGAPLLLPGGIAALVTGSDSIAVRAIALAGLAGRVRAAGAPWNLQPAANLAPTSPQAVRVDLAETLNQYLFAVRNAQALLLQPSVASASFAEVVARYNQAIRRFAAARDRHDGALARRWPPDMLPAWQRLRDALWAVHLRFWKVNEVAATIVRDHRVPPVVAADMRALEPALQDLQRDIGHFLARLAEGGNDEPPASASAPAPAPGSASAPVPGRP